MIRKSLLTAAALLSLGGVGALANYTATQGTGTTFGSVIVGGAHYAQQFLCDLTTPGQCAAVDATGNLSVKSSTLSTAANQTTTNTNLGAPGATACASDTASCSVNQLLQRIAQRVTSMITALGTPFQAGGSIGNTSFGATQSGTWNINNVSGTVSLPTGASTSANQTSQITQETAINTVTGTTTDAATTAGGTGTNAAKLRLITTQLDNINTNVQGAIPAGTNDIGNAGTTFPIGATAVRGSATGTTAATAASLAATSGKTNFVCGISIRANATAAATGNATMSDGTSTLNFTQWTAPAASGLGVIEQIFTPCRPASGANVAWTATSAAPGTGGVVSVAIWGYQK
jgi:hypothetical protein